MCKVIEQDKKMEMFIKGTYLWNTHFIISKLHNLQKLEELREKFYFSPLSL